MAIVSTHLFTLLVVSVWCLARSERTLGSSEFLGSFSEGMHAGVRKGVLDGGQRSELLPPSSLRMSVELADLGPQQ